MNISDYDHLSVPLPKVKDPTPYFPTYRPTPSISSPLRQVVNNESISIGNSSRIPIIPNLNLTPPPSPTLTFDHQPNLKCPNEPKDPNELNLPPYASIARASSSLEPQTTTKNKQKSPMPTEMSSKQKNQASSSYPVYPDHQRSMRDGFVENIHHTQRIPLIQNYGHGLGWIERRQLIPIEESAVKKCGNNIVGDNRLAKVFIPNMPLIMRSQSSEKIMGNPQSSLQQMNIEHNKIENCKGTPAKASSSCPVITLQAMLKMMMGEKIYSESRQTIINHQQIFTYQVSELHRIVAVQKELINSSNAQQSTPLKSDTSLLPKSSPKPSRNEASTIQIMGSYPRPTNLQNSNVGNTIINNFPTLYLPSQGNQLLLPMISPTEGLIYKICPSLPNGVYTYVQPHSSIQNMKSSSEFSPSPSSCVIRDHETNLNDVKDSENVNSTPTNPTSPNF